ncbi:hypothetical protein CKO22_02000 [Thiococcus pfennigii]|nr:hypothetical protein [Thiococcus pfennigii]
MRLFTSLRSAVLLFVVFPLLGVIVALGTLGLRALEHQVTQRLQDDIELVARSIRLPIAAAMARRDAETVQEGLDSVFQIDQVFGAYVYDADGRLVAANGPRSPSLDRRREDAAGHICATTRGRSRQWPRPGQAVVRGWGFANAWARQPNRTPSTDCRPSDAPAGTMDARADSHQNHRVQHPLAPSGQRAAGG